MLNRLLRPLVLGATVVCLIFCPKTRWLSRQWFTPIEMGQESVESFNPLSFLEEDKKKVDV